MGVVHRITPDERAGIIADLQAGMRPLAIARKWQRSKRSVTRIANEAGLSVSGQAEKRLVLAARTWTVTERLELLGKGLAKAEALLETVTGAGGLQMWAVAVGVLIDKRRLEEGDVTQRTEVQHGGARERITSRITQLAERRRAS